MKYQKTYQLKELEALKDWFSANMNRLPQTFAFHDAVVCDDVRLFVESTMHVVHDQAENPVFGMQINYLFQLKDAIENADKVGSSKINP